MGLFKKSSARAGQTVLGFGVMFLVSACGANSPSVPDAGLSVANTPDPVSIATGGAVTSNDETLINPATSGEEFFSASKYGVSASPRVARGSRLRRGGGYNKIGKSYVVKGKRYHPTENPTAIQTGRASWYGKAFHGRLTANGETYDMNHLTAAHKTMPLPSYARVTNVKNGRSVIVRVNDRGPFSNNRVIDVSKRAAEVLDFINAGTAHVKVEYAGRAPLHGQDDDFLLASINGNNATQRVASASLQRQLPGVRPAAEVPDTINGYLPDLFTDEYANQRISAAFGLSAQNWKRTNR